MRQWMFYVAVCLACAAGCSDKAKEAVAISGTVKTAAGKPVTGVRLIFAPAKKAPMSAIGSFGFALDAEGHFEGAAIPGTYVFYLTTVAIERDDDDGHPVNNAEAQKLMESNQVMAGIPAPYRGPVGAGPDRQVEVKSGATFTLTLSQ